MSSPKNENCIKRRLRQLFSLPSVIYCVFNIDTTFQLFSDNGRWGSLAALGSPLVWGSTGFGLAWVTGDPGRMVGLVAGWGCSHSDERRLVPWVVNLLSRVPGRSGVAWRVCGRTCDGLRVACVSLRALSYHSDLAGVCAFPVFRSISSAPEWHVVGSGVALHPGIGHFSIYWPRAVWCRDGGGSAGVGACHFCAAGRLGHMVRGGPGGVWHHSICVCMCMGLRGWGPDCLAVDNRDAGGYADPSLILIVCFAW